MRPTHSKEKEIIVLSKYNFEAWREDVEDRCIRKGMTAQKQKIAFLRQGLTTTQKNQLRTALQVETEKPSSERKLYGDADPASKPFSWAIGFIRDKIVQKGLSDENIAEEAEKLKMELAALKIGQFGFDLQKFYNRFHSKHELISAMGITVDDNILSMHFQNGCLEHKDLKHLTQDETKRRGKNYTELFTEYEHALERARAHGTSRRRERDRNPNNKGRNHKTRNNDKQCSHCKKYGHEPDDCWTKHPEKLPDWVKNKKKGNEE